MLLRLLKAIPSMFVSAHRPAGRSWFYELLVRSARSLLDNADVNDLFRLRKNVDNAPYHPANSKVSISMRELAGVPCMLLSPKTGASSEHVIVYFHGGGYIVGSPTSHKSILAQLALSTNGLVIAPDYRLAPEHPFPAPQDDCLTVANLVLKTYQDKKITLAGDSAGGALAIATVRSLASDESVTKQIDKMVLLSPWVEPTAVGGSIKSNEKYDYLVGSFLSESFSALVSEEDYFDDQVNFANADLSELPKTLVHSGGSEMFVDQISSFCERAKQAGSDLQLKEYPGQCHVFQLFSAISKDGKEAMADIASFIQAS